MRFKNLLLAHLFVCLAVPAFADEGMWTPDNFPFDQVNQKYGLHIDRQWVDHVQASAVRLAGGCSASVVSPSGLVLTNHHCVEGCVRNLSTPDRDYAKDGFFTAAMSDEKQCPGMQAEILENIKDVTPALRTATSGKTGAEFGRARNAAIARIEREACEGRERTHRCQVISFFRGGEYKLYDYRKYTDVRLAFAVEYDAAFFGGDPDNFNFPRYDLDFSFLRLYDSGAPAKTPQHLKWNVSAPKSGDPVFVAGNPGGTDRLLTAAQLESLRDVVQPLSIMLNAELRGRLTRFGEESPEHARLAERDLFGLENGLKAMRGEHEALLQPGVIESRRAADAELKRRVDADPELRNEIGDPWKEMEDAQKARVGLYKPYFLLEARAGYGSTLFRYARTLVRSAEERKKPNGERLREYAEARLPLVEKGLLDARPIEAIDEQIKLEFWLSKLREELTADAPETALMLAQDSPQALSTALSASKLGDANLRRKLWDGGFAAIQESNDPMIRFVLRTDSAARAIRTQYDKQVLDPTDDASERIARARMAVNGNRGYPDATFSLRISYGTINGWSEAGRTITPFTNFSGLYRRATGQPPFRLAPRWVSNRDQLDPNTVFDMSSDNDIIGGNSGSPLLNARAEVIGAIFDGNIHSLGGTYFFDPKLNRAVSVSTAAMTEALNKVYGQQRLVAELTAP
jgi:Peptidase S46